MMILEKVRENRPTTFLREHLWSAISRPLITTPGPARSTFFSLDPNRWAEWFTMFEPEAFEAAPAVSATSEGWLCLESFSAQPFLQHVVGRYQVCCQSQVVSTCSSLWPTTWAWTLPACRNGRESGSGCLGEHG